MRFLEAYWFLREVGPLIVLIQKMTVKLFYFFLVLLVFIFAFGISTQSLMYPNQRVDKYLLKKIFFASFFAIDRDSSAQTDILNGR